MYKVVKQCEFLDYNLNRCRTDWNEGDNCIFLRPDDMRTSNLLPLCEKHYDELRTEDSREKWDAQIARHDFNDQHLKGKSEAYKKEYRNQLVSYLKLPDNRTDITQGLGSF